MSGKAYSLDEVKAIAVPLAGGKKSLESISLSRPRFSFYLVFMTFMTGFAIRKASRMQMSVSGIR